MYEHFYKLRAEPFRLSPDHRFCYSHRSYAKAKAYMQYAFHRAEGFVMVTGRPGTGKSTLVNDLIDTLSTSGATVAKLVSTQLEASDLLRMVAHAFGLPSEALHKAALLQHLEKLLMSRFSDGHRALLIIDEAQDLSASALEELRLLTNLQLNSQPLLQIFLLGQEELRAMVHSSGMEQVHQRLVAACHIEQLKEDETKAYILHRLEQVGWKGDPAISNAVYPIVYRFSEGIPRRINLVCSRLFLHGSVEGRHKLGVDDARVVITELQQEQLAFADIQSEMDFDAVDEYDEWVDKLSLAANDLSQARAGATEPAPERDSLSTSGDEVGGDRTSRSDGGLNSSANKELVDFPVAQQEDASGYNKKPDIVERFEPARVTDRSIRDQVILPSGQRRQPDRQKPHEAQDEQAVKKEQLPPAVKLSATTKVVELATRLERPKEQQKGDLPSARSGGIGDALINSPKPELKPTKSWLPMLALSLVILVILAIAAVFIIRPKAVESEIRAIQGWLIDDAVIAEPVDQLPNDTTLPEP